jgi:hypothetical protein
MEDLHIKGIEKVNEFGDPELIKPTELAILDNMVLDVQGGKAIKRGAVNVFNSNFTTASGIKSLHDVIDSAGTNHLLAVSGTVLQKSKNGTAAWSNLKTGLTTGLKMAVLPYNGKFVCFNGTDAPFVTDITTVWTLGVTPPAVTNIAPYGTLYYETPFDTGGDLEVNAQYKWCLVYVTDSGEYSSPSAPFTYYPLTDDVLTTPVIEVGTPAVEYSIRKVTLTPLPVSGDSRVVSKLLFRTKANGDVYYLAATLDNDTTVYTDGLADLKLDTSRSLEYYSAPAVVKYGCVHKERTILGNFQVPKFVWQPTHAKANATTYAGAQFDAALSDTSGSLTTGATYKYRFIWRDMLGQVSGYKETTIVLSGGKTSVDLNHISLPITDVEVRIYRTAANGSTYYYLSSDVDVKGHHWDGTADASLGAETLPAETTGNDTYKSAIIYSEVGQASQFPALNIIQIFPDDGDQITGVVDFQDMVIIYKENSICRLRTLGVPGNWQLDKIYEKRGCDEPLSIKRAGDKIYFRSGKQIYRFPDYMEGPISLSRIVSFRSLTTATDSFYSDYYGWYGVIGGGVVYIYDEKTNCWYKFTSALVTNIGCAIEKLHGNSRNTLLFGYSDLGIVGKYDTTGTSDNNNVTTAQITPKIRTKTFTIKDASAFIRLRILLANYKKLDDQTVTHTLVCPEDAKQKAVTDSTNSTASSDYKNEKYVTDAMTGDLKFPNKVYYEISGIGLTEFNSATLKYRVVNRGKRA